MNNLLNGNKFRYNIIESIIRMIKSTISHD